MPEESTAHRREGEMPAAAETVAASDPSSSRHTPATASETNVESLRVDVGPLSDDDVGRLRRNATIVVLARHLDVPADAPVGRPRVLHDPIVAAGGVRAVTDSQHAVVEIVQVLGNSQKKVRQSTAGENAWTTAAHDRDHDRCN